MSNVSLMFKFGKEEHIDALFRNGCIHCSSVKEIVEYEEKQVRGDEYESVVEFRYMENGTLQLKAPQWEAWKFMRIRDTVLTKKSILPVGNLYCMSVFDLTITSNSQLFKLDQRFSEFGTHFLIIHRPDEFVKRICNSLKDQQIKYSCGRVDYLDLKKYTGNKTMLQKHLTYSFQNEYRFYLHTQETRYIQFSIGSIEDIAEIYEFSKAKEFLYKSQIGKLN